MIYYRVLAPHDVYIPVGNSEITLIYNELYTQKELDKITARLAKHHFHLNLKYFERLDLKRSEVYWFFGCRFMTEEAKERIYHV